MITAIWLQGFERVENDATHALGKVTRISGQNGCGKSAIARAAYWILTGRDINGSVMTTRYLADASDAVAGRIEWTATDGTSHTLERTRRRSGTQTLVMDGQPSTDAAVMDAIGIPSSDVLGCAMMPGMYWLNLSQDDRRAVLMSILPSIDLEALYRKRFPNGPIIAWEQGTETILKTYTACRIDYEKKQAGNAGRQSILREQAATPTEPQIEESAVKAAKKRASEAKAVRDGMLSAQHDWEKYDEAKAAYDNYHCQPDGAGETPEPRDLVKLGANLDACSRAHRTSQAAIDAKTTEATKLHSDATAMETRKACDRCGRPWEPDPKAIEDLKRKAEFADKQVVALREMAATTEKDLKAAQDAFDAAEKHNAFCRSLPNRPAMLPEPTALRRQQDVINEAIEAAVHLSAQAEQIAAQFAAQVERWRSIHSAREQIVKAEAEAQGFATQIEALRTMEAVLHPRTGIEAEALAAQAASLQIPGFVVELEEIQKNGKSRPACRLVREADGLPSEWLSDGEKMKAEIALSQRIYDLTGSTFRVTWLALRAVMDRVMSVPGQLIVEVPVKGQDLKVEVVG